jgi:hypothetical protein
MIEVYLGHMLDLFLFCPQKRYLDSDSGEQSNNIEQSFPQVFSA